MVTTVNVPRDTRAGELGAGLGKAFEALMNAKLQKEMNERLQTVQQRLLENDKNGMSYEENIANVYLNMDAKDIGNEVYQNLLGNTIKTTIGHKKPIDKEEMSKQITDLILQGMRGDTARDVANIRGDISRDVANIRAEATTTAATTAATGAKATEAMRQKGAASRQAARDEAALARERVKGYYDVLVAQAGANKPTARQSIGLDRLKGMGISPETIITPDMDEAAKGAAQYQYGVLAARAANLEVDRATMLQEIKAMTTTMTSEFNITMDETKIPAFIGGSEAIDKALLATGDRGKAVNLMASRALLEAAKSEQGAAGKKAELDEEGKLKTTITSSEGFTGALMQQLNTEDPTLIPQVFQLMDALDKRERRENRTGLDKLSEETFSAYLFRDRKDYRLVVHRVGDILVPIRILTQ